MKVIWITGRKKFLAHAIAVFFAELQGGNWSRMPQAERDALIDKCNKRIDNWAANDVLASFLHDYKEKG